MRGKGTWAKMEGLAITKSQESLLRITREKSKFMGTDTRRWIDLVVQT